jgi:hypothetical protein
VSAALFPASLHTSHNFAPLVRKVTLSRPYAGGTPPPIFLRSPRIRTANFSRLIAPPLPFKSVASVVPIYTAPTSLPSWPLHARSPSHPRSSPFGWYSQLSTVTPYINSLHEEATLSARPPTGGRESEEEDGAVSASHQGVGDGGDHGA